MHVKYFPDFKSMPVLLIAGESDGFLQFSAFLQEWEREPLVTDLSGLHWLKLDGSISVLIKQCASGDAGLRVVDLSAGKFVWLLDLRSAKQFSNQLDEVARSKAPCHAYLDGNQDDVQVVASIGEYGAENNSV